MMSWVAELNDFTRTTPREINLKDSPNLNLHRHWFKDHQEHIILSGKEGDDPGALMLASAIRKEFPDRQVRIEYMDLFDVIDVDEIKPKVERLIRKNREHEIDIFWSPGTSMMQLSWYIVHTEGIAKTRIVQGVRASVTGTRKARFFETRFKVSKTPVSIMVRSDLPDEKPTEKDNYLLTPSLEPIYQRALKIAAVDKVTTLIRGDSGTGKEHLSRYIHLNSGRKNREIITVNCSALGDSLLESRLFGYAKGAFTGADKDQEGLFEQANGGTIFLDEIGDISSYMQQSLLRAIQEGEIMRVGENVTREIDVRIIAATNRDLEKRCAEGTFRWDLYYRLVVTELELPSLQERGRDEIKEMLNFFLRSKAGKFGRKQLKLAKEARESILSYPFPGNLREMENLIENLYVFCEGRVQLNDLPKRVLQRKGLSSFLLADIEAAHIKKVFEFHNGNLSQTARALGVALNTLKSKLEKASDK